ATVWLLSDCHSFPAPGRPHYGKSTKLPVSRLAAEPLVPSHPWLACFTLIGSPSFPWLRWGRTLATLAQLRLPSRWSSIELHRDGKTPHNLSLNQQITQSMGAFAFPAFRSSSSVTAEGPPPPCQ
ncbi:hypothetical protein EWB00_001267, partial [Schistosoma japonicum]